MLRPQAPILAVSLALALSSECLRDSEQRQRNPARPQHIVKRLGICLFYSLVLK